MGEARREKRSKKEGRKIGQTSSTNSDSYSYATDPNFNSD